MVPTQRHSKGPKAPLPADTGLDLTFEAVDLIHKIGSQRMIERTVTSDKYVGDPTYGVMPGTPIAVAASLESVEEGIFVHGTAETEVHGECSRCLDPVSETLNIEFNELFTYPDKVPSDLEEDDIPVLESDEVDLAQLVHDALALAVPFQPLCREECPGLCSECGFRMEDDLDHAHTIIDPRFAQLAQLLDSSDADEDGAQAGEAQL